MLFVAFFGNLLHEHFLKSKDEFFVRGDKFLSLERINRIIFHLLLKIKYRSRKGQAARIVHLKLYLLQNFIEIERIQEFSSS